MARFLRRRFMATKRVERASIESLRALSKPWMILDVRDANEVAAGKGGPPPSVPGSVHCPLNMDGVPQSQRETTLEEFRSKLQAAGVKLPEDRTVWIVTHCGTGGRGGRAAELLRQMGYGNVLNGGSPNHIATALQYTTHS